MGGGQWRWGRRGRCDGAGAAASALSTLTSMIPVLGTVTEVVGKCPKLNCFPLDFVLCVFMYLARKHSSILSSSLPFIFTSNWPLRSSTLSHPFLSCSSPYCSGPGTLLFSFYSTAVPVFYLLLLSISSLLPALQFILQVFRAGSHHFFP